MTRDGRNEGGISPMDEVIHMICSPHGILHLLHGSIHLVHLPFQMWYPTSNGTSRLVSFSIILSPSYFEFWPCSSPHGCWRCLLTSLVNSWFCCVISAIAIAMDYNCCWTVVGGGGARFGWWEVFPLSWCPRLVAIDLVRTMQPFCLGKGKEVNT